MVYCVVEPVKSDDTLLRVTVPKLQPNITSTPKPEQSLIIAGHRSRFHLY